MNTRGGHSRAGRQQGEHHGGEDDRAQVLDVPKVLDVQHVPQMAGFPGRHSALDPLDPLATLGQVDPFHGRTLQGGRPAGWPQRGQQ
jgi:hypothetical protein